MNSLKLLLLFVALGLSVRGAERPPAVSPSKPNILMIAIDDLNDWIGCLGGHPQARTPNLDALAARGTLFTNAHCQSPLCNPSRASLMTGLRPSTTGIYGLAPGIRDVARTRDHVTLPQTFTSAGYHTFTCGKVYHDGSIKPKDQKAEFSTWGPAPGMGRPAKPFANLPAKDRHPLMDWGAFPERDEDAADYKIASAAIGALKPEYITTRIASTGRNICPRSLITVPSLGNSLRGTPTRPRRLASKCTAEKQAT